MPELPDVTVYLEALTARILHHRLEHISIRGPFLLRTAAPSISAAENREVVFLRRLGKRIAIGLEDDLWLLLHLMIAGRLHWKPAMPKPTDKRILAAFQFDSGVLTLTEAGTQHRASLHLVSGEPALAALDPGGRDPLTIPLEDFGAALRSENHTLKRALTDPRLFSGIGNAYSDEILHRARLSPVAMTLRLSPEDLASLHHATREVLTEWIARLRTEAGGKFPENVTAFRPGMAVHGRYGQPCPGCGTKIQRIRYAANETNYCPVCQTGGKLLADRSLSRLLHSDWPKTMEELEALKKR
ncbi:MAG TPA: DNA-formamidopyrimidine glycosylase family protein [Bryobacteraceae bacterium]|nr:DNA-formamidopyrimidine glycosylase family protein [Bryobacteraceae bacterium]